MSGRGVGEGLHLKEPPFLGVCFKTQKSKKGWWIAAYFRSEVALAHTLWLCIISRIFVALDLGVRVRAWEQPLGSPGLVQLKGCQSLSLGRGWGWELHPPFAEQASGSQTSNRRPEPRPSKLCQAKRTFCLTHRATDLWDIKEGREDTFSRHLPGARHWAKPFYLHDLV